MSKQRKAFEAGAMPITLQVKLAGVIVHADEYLIPFGHGFDKTVLLGLVNDPEVQAWIKSLGALAPVKRGK